jgi:hypothetical protein
MGVDRGVLIAVLLVNARDPPRLDFEPVLDHTQGWSNHVPLRDLSLATLGHITTSLVEVPALIQ